MQSQPAVQAPSPYRLLADRAARYPDNDLLVVPEAVRELWQLEAGAWSYAAVLRHVDALAEQYCRAGYGKGHRVALLLENRPQHYFHWLALNAVGASAVPVNPDATADEIRYVLEHSGCALAVAVAPREEQIAAQARLAGIPIALDGGGQPAAASPPPQAGAQAPEDEAALLYTSGTTGKPKGCVLSNAYFIGWAEWYCAQGGLITLRPGAERLMTPLPTFHVNAMGNSFMGMLGAGGAQIIVDRFHPRSWWQSAIETRATCFHYLGVMPAILMALPPSELDRAHGLRFGMGGGVHPDHHAAFEERFGVPLLEGWAMTETGAGGILCANREPRHVGRRCIGRPDRDGTPLEVRLVDDAGNDVAAGQDGELLLRAAGNDPRRRFFSRYLHDEAATEEVWRSGWLHTGDVMRQGPDGSLFFVERKKNIIRRSGENIAAVEVEAAIASHPEVRQVAVIAVDDPLRGEEVLAAVVADAGATGDANLASRIFEHCAGRLAYYKLPGYVVFVDALPTTSTQKVRKSDLGPLARNPQDHAGCHDFRRRKQNMRKVVR